MTKNNVLEKVTKKQLLTPENTMYYTILHQHSTQPPKGPQVHYLTYISYYHIQQQKQYPAKRSSGTLPYKYILLNQTTNLTIQKYPVPYKIL